jgi:hypothetical protein
MQVSIMIDANRMINKYSAILRLTGRPPRRVVVIEIKEIDMPDKYRLKIETSEVDNRHIFGDYRRQTVAEVAAAADGRCRFGAAAAAAPLGHRDVSDR